MKQKFYVYFTFEGILGRESFETAETGLDAYQDAFSQFYAYARSIGAAHIYIYIYIYPFIMVLRRFMLFRPNLHFT